MLVRVDSKCYVDSVLIQGLIIPTPVEAKSDTFRVTTVIPWTIAVAAMSASRSGRLSGTWSLAQCRTTAVSTGKIRPANAVITCRSSQVLSAAPCAVSRRSARSTPISISRTEMTDKNNLAAGMLSAHAMTFASALPVLPLLISAMTLVSTRNVRRVPTSCTTRCPDGVGRSQCRRIQA